MKHVRSLLILPLSFAALAHQGFGETRAAELEILRQSIDGGGVMQSTDGVFELSGTIGQPDAGAMSNRDLELSGGFWFPLDRGDCNRDGSVNLTDYGDWVRCLSGPEQRLPVGCACFDTDDDGDVDMIDLADFQGSFNGS